MNKMKDVYEKSPQMGDPSSLQPKIAETMSNIEKLRMEIHKNEVSVIRNTQRLNAFYNAVTFNPFLHSAVHLWHWRGAVDV